MSVGLLDWVPRRATDARFGELRYWRGHWTSRSAACFGMSRVEVHVPGTRDGLLTDARELFESVESSYPALKPQILAHFHEHYEPYADMLAELPETRRRWSEASTPLRICGHTPGLSRSWSMPMATREP